MSTKYIIVSMFVMALTTYVIRMLPMAIFRKKINDKRVQSCVYYVADAGLSAISVPAIFSSKGSGVCGVVGLKRMYRDDICLKDIWRIKVIDRSKQVRRIVE